MIQINEAGPIGFLRTLLILVLIYYVVKFLFKLFAPYLLKKAVDKVQKNAEKQYRNQQRETSVDEGKTVIDKKPENSKQSNNSVGEYVDFEEID